MEWCAAATKYRCMRCGRSSNKVKILGTGEVQSGWVTIPNKVKRWERKASGRARHGEDSVRCRKCYEPLQAGKIGHKKSREYDENNLQTRRRKGA